MKTLKRLVTLISLTVFAQGRAQDSSGTTSVNKVISVYLDLKNALVATNNVQAISKAMTLLAAINAVSTD